MIKEFNFFGIYFAPFAVYLLAAVLIFFPLRRLFDRYDIDRWVWHRQLFDCSVFLIILSLVGLL